MALYYLIPAAFILDLLLGDPPNWPHPVRWIGRLAMLVEKVSRALFNDLYLAGVAAVLTIVMVSGAAVVYVLQATDYLHPWLAATVALYLLYTTLAARDLARHSKRVFVALAADDLQLARAEVAMIVGRDTAVLDKAGVVKACVESVAENIVDGITAPLFWAAVAGPVGAVVYKAINTMDSLFGYKNERYLQFGWAAAKLDDVANYIPARLTAILVIIAAAILRLSANGAWRIWRRDHDCHASPNCGHTEAAVAGALGIQLGGVSLYFGEPVAKPTIGDVVQPVTRAHILAANRIMLLCAGLAAAVAALSHYIFLN